MDRPRPPSLRAQWVIAGAVLAVSATLARVAYTRFPALYDVDAYYHLAVARAYAERGFFQTLDWARFSVLHDTFGDKEFLFHAWLRPFASATDATAGGFTALAMLDGLVAATLAYQSMRSIGPWGVAIPFLVFGGSVDFTSRLVRLRPEILSLVLIMVAIDRAGRAASRPPAGPGRVRLHAHLHAVPRLSRAVRRLLRPRVVDRRTS